MEHGIHLANSSAILIRSLTPNAKFIVIIRDPVTRMYSQYKMHYAVSPQHFDDGVRAAIHDFNACIAEEGYSELCIYGNIKSTVKSGRKSQKPYNAMSNLRPGLYHLYLREWFYVFPRDRFLIIKAESYYKDVYGYITDKVFPFLKLYKITENRTQNCIENQKPVHVTSQKLRKNPKAVNKSYSAPMLETTKQLLYEFYKPYNYELATLLIDPQWIWQGNKKWHWWVKSKSIHWFQFKMFPPHKQLLNIINSLFWWM